jgi:DNA-directed RNA polymerase II subunit RPB1
MASAFPWTPSNAPVRKVKAVQFGILSPDEIKELSVVTITSSELDVNSSSDGGVYDKHLGPLSKTDICATCQHNFTDCPGHFAAFELAKPVYHAGFLNYILSILRCICIKCYKLRVSTSNEDYKKALEIKDVGKRLKAIQDICEKVKECKRSSNKKPAWRIDEDAEPSETNPGEEEEEEMQNGSEEEEEEEEAPEEQEEAPGDKTDESMPGLFDYDKDTESEGAMEIEGLDTDSEEEAGEDAAVLDMPSSCTSTFTSSFAAMEGMSRTAASSPASSSESVSRPSISIAPSDSVSLS